MIRDIRSTFTYPDLSLVGTKDGLSRMATTLLYVTKLSTFHTEVELTQYRKIRVLMATRSTSVSSVKEGMWLIHPFSS